MSPLPKCVILCPGCPPAESLKLHPEPHVPIFGQLMNIFIPQPKLLIQISETQLVIIPASYKILSWLSEVSSP